MVEKGKGTQQEATTELLIHRLTDQDYLVLQSRSAITGRHAAIAAQIGCYPSKISQYSNGTYHLPAYRLFAISAAQRNWRYAQLLAEHAGAILFPVRPPQAPMSTMQWIARTVIGFGRFLGLAEQVQDGGPLTDEQQRELEQTGQDIKDGVDALIAKARAQRSRQKTPRDTHNL